MNTLNSTRPNQEHPVEHHHDHQHHSDVAGENIATAFFLNLFFCAIEAVGGFLTNSIAIMSDALHDLGDSISLGLAWYFQKVSKRKPDHTYTYGYKRFTILSAFLNSVILLTGSVFVLTESIKRVFDPVQSNARGMFILAVLGVLVNGVAVVRLKKGDSLNERVVSLHMLEDVLGWVAVLIGSLVMMVADLPVLDPLLSVGISIFILYNVFNNLRSVFRVLLQGKPSDIDEEAVKKTLLALPKVIDLHDLHIWSMDNEYMILTVHLVVAVNIKTTEQQALRAAAHDCLKKLNIQHATIEIEETSETCEWCDACD